MKNNKDTDEYKNSYMSGFGISTKSDWSTQSTTNSINSNDKYASDYMNTFQIPSSSVSNTDTQLATDKNRIK